MIDHAAVDRKVYRAVHGKKVVRDFLMAAGEENAWHHRSGHTSSGLYEEWRRGNWTLRMEWSEGGRIKGAGLHETQVDPDTGRPARYPISGDPLRFFRLGIVAGESNKKGWISMLLNSPPNAMSETINTISEARRR